MSAFWRGIDAGIRTLPDRYVVAHLIGVRNSPKVWTHELERTLRAQTELIELKRNELLLRRKIRVIMNNPIPARLNALMGQAIKINSIEVVLDDWSVEESGQYIINYIGAENGKLQASKTSIAGLLSTLEKEVGAKPPKGLPWVPTEQAPAPVATATPASTLSQVSRMLLEAMQRVETDASYIPTAKALADTAQVITNVAKVQLEALKSLRA